jgi:HEAT repeat protein
MTLKKVGAPAIPVLRRAIESPSLRQGVIETFGRIGVDAAEAVPDILKYLDSDNQFIRLACLRALKSIGTYNDAIQEGLTKRVNEGRETKALRDQAKDVLKVLREGSKSK